MGRRPVAAASLLLAALLLAALIFFAARGPGRTPDTWETALDAHVEALGESTGRAWTVAASMGSADPGQFTASMRTSSHGRGVFYQVDAVVPQATPTPGVFGLSPELSRKSVPYPPRELVCVMLEATGEDAPPARLVYVALHQDLYNAAWIGHEADVLPVDPDTARDLAALGCASVLAPN